MLSAGLLLLGMMQAGATPPTPPPPTSTLLDTVKIKAAAKRDENREEFEARRRGGVGRYLTAADLEKRQVAYTSEIFRSFPGTSIKDGILAQRGIFTETCPPAVFINGLFVGDSALNVDTIDTIVSPRDVLGIEIYSPGTAPVEYQRALTSCGTVLFWTKNPNDGRQRRGITKGTVVTALITAGSMFAISRFFLRD